MEKQPPKNKHIPEISFRPITEGLGFHPFSDGLPYAPVVKNSKPQLSNQPIQQNLSNGIGAVSAGPPAFTHRVKTSPAQRTGMNIPNVSVPVAPVDTKSTIKQPLVRERASITSQPIHTAFEKPAVQLKVEQTQSNKFNFGYVFRRIFAYNIDVIINLAISVGTLTGISWLGEINLGILLNENIVLVSIVLFSILNWFLLMLQEVTFKTTLGKHIFGLGFQASGLLIFARALFFIPSFLFFGLGIAWSVIDRQKRCWHDLVVGVQPTL